VTAIDSFRGEGHAPHVKEYRARFANRLREPLRPGMYVTARLSVGLGPATVIELARASILNARPTAIPVLQSSRTMTRKRAGKPYKRARANSFVKTGKRPA